MRRPDLGPRGRAYLRWAGALAIVAACAWALATRVDAVALARALAGADYRLVAVMTAAHLALFLGLKALRWRLLLVPVRRVPLARLYAYLLAGCAITNLFPARAGQGARIMLLRRDEVPIPGAVAGLVLEEIANAAVLGLLCLPVPLLLELPGGVRASIAVVTGGALVALALLLALARFGRARAAGVLRQAADGLGVLGSARAAAAVLVLTVAMWLVDLGQIALAMAAAGVAPSYAGVALVLLVVNLTNAVPATPGQLGVFEAAAAAACVLVGATVEQGVTVGVLYHMMQLLPETALGLAVLGRGAVAPRAIARAGAVSGR